MKKNGFTLIEVLLAGVISTSCLTILIGSFALGLKTTRNNQMHSTAARISENLQARLLTDADWPMPQNQTLAYTNGIYRTNFYFDFDGSEKNQNEALLRVEINFVDPRFAHYSSSRLDLIFLDFYESKNNDLITRHYIQRAHLYSRP